MSTYYVTVHKCPHCGCELNVFHIDGNDCPYCGGHISDLQEVKAKENLSLNLTILGFGAFFLALFTLPFLLN